MQTTLAPPTPRDIDDALAVVTNPARFQFLHANRTTAWANLKRARGQSVDLAKLSEMQDQLRTARIRRVAQAAVVALFGTNASPHRRARAAISANPHPDFGGAA